MSHIFRRLSIKAAFAYLIAGSALINAALKTLIGSLVVDGLGFFLSVDGWVVLVISLVGFWYLLSGLWAFLSYGLDAVERTRHRRRH